MILINFKLYPETFGAGALKLAKTCFEVSRQTGVNIVPVVSALDLFRVKQQTGSTVFLQHLDFFTQGPHSGFISPLQAQTLGADGTLLNHSEHRLKPGTIGQILALLPPPLVSVVCLQTLGQVKWARKLTPSYFAYEPREFIGNRHVSVASAKPETIAKFVSLLPSVPLLVGAGIHSRADIATSLKLGAKGVIIATDVVKSPDPKAELLDLAAAFSV